MGMKHDPRAKARRATHHPSESIPARPTSTGPASSALPSTVILPCPTTIAGHSSRAAQAPWHILTQPYTHVCMPHMKHTRTHTQEIGY